MAPRPLRRSAVLAAGLAWLAAGAWADLRPVPRDGSQTTLQTSSYAGLASRCSGERGDSWLSALSPEKSHEIVLCFDPVGWNRLGVKEEADGCDGLRVCRDRPRSIEAWTRAYVRHLEWLDTLDGWGQGRVNPYDLQDLNRAIHDPMLGENPRERLTSAFQAALAAQSEGLVAAGRPAADVAAKAAAVRAYVLSGPQAASAGRLKDSLSGPGDASALLAAFFDRQSAVPGAPAAVAAGGSVPAPGPRKVKDVPGPGPQTLRIDDVPGPGLQSDTDVKVGRVVFYFAGDGLTPTLAAFLRQRDPSMEVAVLVPDRQTALRLGRLIDGDWGVPGPKNVRLSVCDEGFGCPGSLSVWSRDHYALVREGGSWHALSARKNHEYIAGEASAVRNFLGSFLPEKRSEIQFEGGQVVASPDRVFLSADALYKNPDHSADEIAQAFGQESGKPVTILPHLRNWPHIDLYVTPVGRKTIVVGDSREGARLLGEWAATGQAQGHPILRDLSRSYSGSGDALYRQGTGLEGLLRHSEMDAEKLDEIAAALESQGYEVKRVPLLTGRLGSNPILTYNNVFQSGKDVFIPAYGIGPLDRAAQQVYRDLGRRPKPLPAYELAKFAGAVHCTINVLPSSRETGVRAAR